jgi:hypothetical protein
MQKKYQKISLTMLALMFSFMLITNSAKAANDYTVTITGTEKIKEDSLVLNIACPELAKKKVNIKVNVENADKDSDSNKAFKQTLDKNGKGELKITGLESGTVYNFKIKIKKTSDSTYSDYSTVSSATTKGAKYSAKIESIKNIKDDSLTLKVAATKLKGKTVSIQVRIENKDEDDVETKILEKTLDKSGKVDVKIEDLDSDTKYGFKVKIKKSTDSDYSTYSDEKTATTKD